MVFRFKQIFLMIFIMASMPYAAHALPDWVGQALIYVGLQQIQQEHAQTSGTNAAPAEGAREQQGGFWNRFRRLCGYAYDWGLEYFHIVTRERLQTEIAASTQRLQDTLNERDAELHQQVAQAQTAGEQLTGQLTALQEQVSRVQDSVAKQENIAQLAASSAAELQKAQHAQAELRQQIALLCGMHAVITRLQQ